MIDHMHNHNDWNVVQTRLTGAWLPDSGSLDGNEV